MGGVCTKIFHIVTVPGIIIIHCIGDHIAEAFWDGEQSLADCMVFSMFIV